MAATHFNIPFRPHTSSSDFSCKDGEINFASGLSDANGVELSSVPDSEADISNSLPSPDISFALVRSGLPGWNIHPDIYPSKTLAGSETIIEYWNKQAAGLLGQFQDDASCQGRFVAPFSVFALWQSRDGNYLSPSAPMLMIPNSNFPMVATEGDVAASELELKIAAAICRLTFRISIPESMRDFAEKILSVKIYVSEPIYKYKSYDRLIPLRRVGSDTFTRCLDPVSGIISDSRVCTETFPLAWKSVAKENILHLSDESLARLKYFPFASLPLQSADRFESWTDLLEAPEIEIISALQSEGRTISQLVSNQVPDKRAAELLLMGNNEDFRLLTRPLKLNSAGRFKQMKGVALRGNFNPESVTLALYGSRDMHHWYCIGKRRGGLTLCSSPRLNFFRVEVSGHLGSSETLEGMTIVLK